MSPPHTTTARPIRPGSAAAWQVALRPKTLWIATIPVFVGTAISWSVHDAFAAWVAALALAGAIVVQVITNLQNDVGYTARGAETGRRVGLPRATAQGWLAPRAVRGAIVVAVLAALAIAAPLVAYRDGWVIAITLASIVAAYAYMGGPRPIAYTPTGEFVVFLFFGLMAVCGTVYVQAGTVGAIAWIAGTGIGLLAAAVLVVNNHRDSAHDATTGRRTFAVVFGGRASFRLYLFCTLVPFALAAAMAALARSPWYLLPLIALPRAATLGRDLLRMAPGPAYNALLFRTVMLEVLFGALLTVGAVFARLH